MFTHKFLIKYVIITGVLVFSAPMTETTVPGDIDWDLVYNLESLTTTVQETTKERTTELGGTTPDDATTSNLIFMQQTQPQISTAEHILNVALQWLVDSVSKFFNKK